MSAMPQGRMWIHWPQGAEQGMTEVTLTAFKHQEKGVCLVHAHVFEGNHLSLVESSQNRKQKGILLPKILC